MYARRFLVALAIVGGTLTFAGQASAQCGAGFGGGLGYGGYWGVGDLYRVLSQNVPHFAAFPPVYYSVPVPRTYGYSPFAYLPHVQTPEAAVSAPAMIENPYFPSSTEKKEGAPQAADADLTTGAGSVGPRETLNPFVGPELQSPALQAAR